MKTRAFSRGANAARSLAGWFRGGLSHRAPLISFAIYALLILISFIILYPLLHMISQSFMTEEDLMRSSSNWLPMEPTPDNYVKAAAVLRYQDSLVKTLYLVGVSTVCQVFTCSLVGYGLARYAIPGKKLLFGVLLLSYLLPSQATSMPNFLLLKMLKLVDGSIKPFLITSLLGAGVKSALCILIFYNFHRQTPKALTEAAQIDGAGHIRCYAQIAVPLAMPAIIVVTLFTFVWYWNDTNLIGIYLNATYADTTSLTTLMVKLSGMEEAVSLAEYWNLAFTPIANRPPSTLNEARIMAGTMLSIAPLLILYGCLQRYFVESIDHVGITGE